MDNILIGLACKNFNIMIVVVTSYLFIVQYIIKQYCRVDICHIRTEWGRRMGSVIISVNVCARMKITRAVNLGSLMNHSNSYSLLTTSQLLNCQYAVPWGKLFDLKLTRSCLYILKNLLHVI